MNNSRGQDQETPVVAGFEVPRSPDASYNNIYTASEDDGRDPPIVPQHLQHTVLSYPTNGGPSAQLPDPQHVVLNHLYIKNREAPRSVVALGFSHRFRAKYVNVVLINWFKEGEVAAIEIGKMFREVVVEKFSFVWR